MFCPNGHSIEVQERHRGKTGKCPKCQSPFHVPAQNWTPQVVEPADDGGEAAVQQPEDQLYPIWIDDVKLHRVVPGKLKLKPGSLVADCEQVDVGFAADHILLMKVIKGRGLFGGGSRVKSVDVREAARNHLEEVKSIDGLESVECVVLDQDDIDELSIVQPAPYAHESMFAGIPVFGDGRVAVKLPREDGSETLDYLSFSLTDFRMVSAELAGGFGIVGFGAEEGVPLKDDISKLVCHYTDEPLTVMAHVEFYQADEAYDVSVVGWRCESCGLVVSEDARKKEKIGSKSGKGMAKAICPKCKRKFGDNPQHGMVSLGASEIEDSAEDDSIARTDEEPESDELPDAAEKGETDQSLETDEPMDTGEPSEAGETAEVDVDADPTAESRDEV